MARPGFKEFKRPKMLDLPVFPTGDELFLPVAPAFRPFLGQLLALLTSRDNFTSDSSLGGLGAQILAPLIEHGDICGYGAAFRINDRSLEVLEGEGLPTPPWEFNITDVGMLQYRSMES